MIKLDGIKIRTVYKLFVFQTVDKVPRETELSGDFVIFEGI